MPRDRTDPDPDHHSMPIPGGFRAAFTAALNDVGLTVKQWQGTSLVCLNEEGEERTLSLSNVYRRAQNAPRDQWAGIIQEFVQNMSAATDQARLPERLDDAADQIFPRIGLPFPSHLAEAVPWFDPLGDTGLVRNMVVDHPQFMAYVSSKLIDVSGHGADHWVDVARRNLLDNTPADYFSEVGENTGILLGCSSDAYDAARAQILDDLLPGHGEHGFFVAVPTRDVLVVLPVTQPGLVHVHVLKRFAVDNFKSRPYPISDEVFWVRGGRWMRFPVAFSGDTIQVTPPREFLEVLRALSPGDEIIETEGGGSGNDE